MCHDLLCKVVKHLFLLLSAHKGGTFVTLRKGENKGKIWVDLDKFTWILLKFLKQFINRNQKDNERCSGAYKRFSNRGTANFN